MDLSQSVKIFQFFCIQKQTKSMHWLELKKKLVLAIGVLDFTSIQASPLKKISSEEIFTINSIAKDQNGKIIDPFKGRLDLEKKLFRHTSSAFDEDPLRVLRFARFKSYEQLSSFNLHEETNIYFKNIVASNELRELSPERVWMETKKALENKHSEEFFKAIKKYQLTTPWFEGLKNISCDGDVPELKWADIQRVNGFQLSKPLPTPKIFQKTQESLKQVLDLIACENKRKI